VSPDPSTAESQLGEGGSDNPAGEGPGTETPSPAGRACDVIDCDRDHHAKGLCRLHYQRWLLHPDLLVRTYPTVYTLCPDDLLPFVTQVVENDARQIFQLLWRAIGDWHLLGLLEEESA
jgi:hypothetical protein